MGKAEADECIICRKRSGQVAPAGGPICEGALVFVSHAQLRGEEEEHYLVHLFIEPRRHVADLGKLSEGEAQAIALFTTGLACGLDGDRAYGACVSLCQLGRGASSAPPHNRQISRSPARVLGSARGRVA
jgi:hypothetical protein